MVAARGTAPLARKRLPSPFLAQVLMMGTARPFINHHKRRRRSEFAALAAC